MLIEDDLTNESQKTQLFPVQRRQRIVEFLHRHGAVTLQQLSNALEVSLSTLRRDLDALAQEGIIDRTHGGALLRHVSYKTFEPDFSAALELSPTEKYQIGKCAAQNISPGQSVIFDSGSTVLEAAKVIVAMKIDILAATNDLQIAQVLGTSPHIRVHVLGGQLRPRSNTLIGEGVLADAQSIHADVLLMGAHALTDNVVSETSPEVAAIKRAFINAATTRKLLIDSSKFRPRVFMQICHVTDLSEIITDAGVPKEEARKIQSTGTKLSIAE